MPQFGNLKQVELRKEWNHEAFDFTQWLIRAENLQLLSNEIGIEIAPKEAEARRGKYSVDILAEEESTGKKVIIENQLEKTDHDHLGKIITYASGYNAEYIVWIVKDANEEHRQAVEWLNEHTIPELYFFLIKLELWKIDESKPAVKFNTLVQPNEWMKVLRDIQINNNLTETKELQLSFWTNFKAYSNEKDITFTTRKPRASRAYDLPIGTSEAYIRLTINTRPKEIGVSLIIKDNQELFDEYFERKQEIEEEIGEVLIWDAPENQKRSSIRMIKSADLENEEKWSEYFEWLMQKAQIFKQVFGS